MEDGDRKLIPALGPFSLVPPAPSTESKQDYPPFIPLGVQATAGARVDVPGVLIYYFQTSVAASNFMASNIAWVWW